MGVNMAVKAVLISGELLPDGAADPEGITGGVVAGAIFSLEAPAAAVI
jgi:hypothetical protein